MRSARVQLYIDRAAGFFEGMRELRQNEATRNSAALLAIHSAVSYTDALRSALGDQDLHADDHGKAIPSLLKLLKLRRWQDQAGITHLKYLLEMKTFVAYGDKRLDIKETHQLAVKAERFRSWADGVGRHLKLEGWADEP